MPSHVEVVFWLIFDRFLLQFWTTRIPKLLKFYWKNRYLLGVRLFQLNLTTMRFWCPTWVHFGAKLAPKIRKTRPKCTSKTHRFFSSLLTLIFVRFGLHLGGSLDALFVRFSRMVRSISAWSASWCSDLLKLLPKRALRIPRINFAMIFNPFLCNVGSVLAATWVDFWRVQWVHR